MRNLHILLLVACFALSACNATKQTPAVSAPITPVQAYVEPEQRIANPGSIYSESDADTLFADSRARRIGDVVMVRVVESMKAENKADLTTSKDTSNQYGVSAFASPLGIVKASAGNFNTQSGPGLVFDTSSVSDTSASGETTRENMVTATLAARVVKLLPGNAMQIEGIRTTQVNGETQYLVVRGIVRPSDIAADNSITSNRIANAHIEYYGQGVVSDVNRPGWLTRLLNNVWPF